MNTKTTFMFRCFALLTLAPFLLACSSERASDAAGGGAAVGGDTAGAESQGGSIHAEGGSPSAGKPAAGRAGAEPAAPLAGQGGDAGVIEGGSAGESAQSDGGEPPAGTGGKPPQPSYVNGCFTFVDRTEEAASRSIVWNDALIFDPARCMRVRVGQTVIFSGDHGNHPMMPQGGDTPNPVGPTAVFTAAGIFGYECIPHPSEMNGAIQVVP